MPKNKKNQMTLINYIEFSKNINNFPVDKITIDIDIFFAKISLRSIILLIDFLLYMKFAKKKFIKTQSR